MTGIFSTVCGTRELETGVARGVLGEERVLFTAVVAVGIAGDDCGGMG